MSLVRVGLLSFAFVLAGCAITGATGAGIPGARAAEGDRDVLELKDGTRYEGRIVEAVGGAFWIEVAGGQLIQVPYTEVAKVTRAEAQADLELPDFEPPRSSTRLIHSGADVGLGIGARLRFQFEKPAVHSLDVRLSLAPFIGGGVYPVAFPGVAVNFLGHSQIHPQVSLNFPGLIATSFSFFSLYPFVGAGAGIVYDPPSPFELHIGAIGGIGGSYIGVIPDVHASFVW